jgi:putative tryptophan/tyrosine transport system substrate-binding protein
VGSAAWFEDHPWQIVDFAQKSRLLALYIRRDYVEIGGTISYGIDYRQMYKIAADYVAKVLRGANPGDLPVQLPVKIELVINLKTAKAIGLTIPETFLVRADEVIE